MQCALKQKRCCGPGCAAFAGQSLPTHLACALYCLPHQLQTEQGLHHLWAHGIGNCIQAQLMVLRRPPCKRNRLHWRHACKAGQSAAQRAHGAVCRWAWGWCTSSGRPLVSLRGTGHFAIGSPGEGSAAAATATQRAHDQVRWVPGGQAKPSCCYWNRYTRNCISMASKRPAKWDL